MTELDKRWAKSQVEAMADDDLSAEAERRMRILMRIDPEIRSEVERARALRLELRALAKAPAPRGLMFRLWRIPSAHRRPQRLVWKPAMALAGIAAIGLTVAILNSPQGPTAEELAREAAIQDFTIAVAYLQKSVLMARNEVNAAVGSGMMEALETSRGAVGRQNAGSSEGVRGNVD